MQKFIQLITFSYTRVATARLYLIDSSNACYLNIKIHLKIIIYITHWISKY